MCLNTVTDSCKTGRVLLSNKPNAGLADLSTAGSHCSCRCSVSSMATWLCILRRMQNCNLPSGVKSDAPSIEQDAMTSPSFTAASCSAAVLSSFGRCCRKPESCSCFAKERGMALEGWPGESSLA